MCERERDGREAERRLAPLTIVVYLGITHIYPSSPSSNYCITMKPKEAVSNWIAEGGWVLGFRYSPWASLSLFTVSSTDRRFQTSEAYAVLEQSLRPHRHCIRNTCFECERENQRTSESILAQLIWCLYAVQENERGSGEGGIKYMDAGSGTPTLLPFELISLWILWDDKLR